MTEHKHPPHSVAGHAPGTDAAQYRKALSCFTTGVTVVSALHEGTDWAMTCNSFASVSLEPRLVLWSIRNAAASLPAYTQSGGFTVSVLSQAQQALALQFAMGDMASRMAGVSVSRRPSGRFHIDDAVAWFDCSLYKVVEAGDHHILIGEVIDFGHSERAALGMLRSQLGQFSALPVDISL